MVLVIVVVKTLAVEGYMLSPAIVVMGMLVVVAGASDVIGALIDVVVLHAPVVIGWSRMLFLTLLASTSVRSPSELERPRGLRDSDGDLASCNFLRRLISARS